MEGQLNLFDLGKSPLKLKKKIRLIELFGGIGCQAKALENIGADFEHYCLVEIDKYAVKSYNALHGTSFEPMDITKVHAEDLNITDSVTFNYILTYSYPCTSLSVSGKMEGMAEGSGTASSLLWEVKRILEEINNDSRYDLPQVLLMENVPQVHSRNNIDDFKKWLSFLDSLGYTTVWQDLNARDYGIAQNRMRTFAVSFLGNHKFDFPKPIPLTKVMLDYCDMYVDEKYFFKGEKVDEIIRQYREEHRTEQNRTEQNRTEQNRTISLSTDYTEISVANCIRTKDRGIQRRRYADNGVLVCNKL